MVLVERQKTITYRTRLIDMSHQKTSLTGGFLFAIIGFNYKYDQ